MTLELYGHTYPNDNIPPNNLSVGYEMEGEYAKAAEHARDAARLDPNSSGAWGNLIYSYMGSNRPDEAQQSLQQALQRIPNSEFLHFVAYFNDLSTGKSAEADRELAWSKGHHLEYRFVQRQVLAVQEQGKLRASEDITKQMLELERNHGLSEAAEGDLASLALLQADFGLCDRALQNATALALSQTRTAVTGAAMILASCGQAQKAEANVARLNRDYPLNSFTQKSEIPQIRARTDLPGNANKAIEDLHPAEAYQFGYIEAGIPAYLRGVAYLQNKQGAQAAAEFRKVLDFRGALGAMPYMALSRLGLARAFLLSGDAAKARVAYQDFFALWKDADPDIPILKQAKAEFAKLQ